PREVSASRPPIKTPDFADLLSPDADFPILETPETPPAPPQEPKPAKAKRETAKRTPAVSKEPAAESPAPSNRAPSQRSPEPASPDSVSKRSARSVYPVRAARPALEEQSGGLQLQSSLQVLAGVGEKQAEKLAKLKLHTIGDALYYFPRRHIDYSALKPINRLGYGEEVTIIASVVDARVVRHKGGHAQITKVILGDGTGSIECNWFNQPWILDKLKVGEQVQVSGKVEMYLGRLLFSSPDWELLENDSLHTGRIVPVYGLTADLYPKQMRRTMYSAVGYGVRHVVETLPATLLQRYSLMPLGEAILQAHFPDTPEKLQQAHRRLAFDEMLLMQLGFRRQRADWQAQTSAALAVSHDWFLSALDSLPFKLTAAQRRVLGEIRADLANPHPMNRLVQGDVGSGKTAVAALAIAIALENGKQAALMAPTSILAEQHYQGLQRLLEKVQIGSSVLPNGAIRLLQGASTAAERREIASGLADGSIRLLIGTHALIEEGVQFQDLGLVVIDEQHRFGVAQRAALRAKGQNPHLLVMTATPIPRSLALSVYGDLDLSIIDQLPPGRTPIATRVVYPRERERAYAFIRSQIDEGRQVFIICPLVEETETSKGNAEAKAAVEEHARLSKHVFPNHQLGLLHGKMKPAEKDTVMNTFRKGETHILVSTSVIEVGVDVPNASVMLIEGANRFGLAQLHQFRGRVGRGQHKSYCLLMTDALPTEKVLGPDDVDARLKVMEATNDGFKLAEKDLELRGPGDFLGTRQSGFAELQMAKLGDVRLIEQARNAAADLYQTDPQLTLPEHAALAIRLERFWQVGAGDVS
ncbi:MAG TPA: ATP-dependent DNA helicase RecG, partial [Anaerolineales bacterium]|nr:ATP-dependent DNA helicase RecG [Anaerolineales bacterium]